MAREAVGVLQTRGKENPGKGTASSKALSGSGTAMVWKTRVQLTAAEGGKEGGGGDAVREVTGHIM